MNTTKRILSYLKPPTCQPTNQRIPRDPNMWNRLGQPIAKIIWGDVDRPRMEPKNMPLYTRARERLRSFTGTHLRRAVDSAFIIDDV